jgi:hypothetical protein
MWCRCKNIPNITFLKLLLMLSRDLICLGTKRYCTGSGFYGGSSKRKKWVIAIEFVHKTLSGTQMNKKMHGWNHLRLITERRCISFVPDMCIPPPTFPKPKHYLMNWNMNLRCRTCVFPHPLLPNQNNISWIEMNLWHPRLLF